MIDQTVLTKKTNTHIILQMMREHEIKRVSELCRQAKLSHSEAGALISGKQSPWNKDGSWCLAVEKLADFFACSPEYLFACESDGLRKQAEVTFGQTCENEAIKWAEQALPERVCEQKELERIVDNILSTLTPREERVLRLRFGIGLNKDHTLEEVSSMFDVAKERIRQIEAKSLRKIRSPERSDYFRQFIFGNKQARIAERKILTRRNEGKDPFFPLKKCCSN